MKAIFLLSMTVIAVFLHPWSQNIGTCSFACVPRFWSDEKKPNNSTNKLRKKHLVHVFGTLEIFDPPGFSAELSLTLMQKNPNFSRFFFLSNIGRHRSKKIAFIFLFFSSFFFFKSSKRCSLAKKKKTALVAFFRQSLAFIIC